MVGKGNLLDLEFEFFENVVFENFGYNTNLNISRKTFGPEIGLAKVLAEDCKDKDFLIVKYAINGSAMWNWDPVYDQNKAKLTSFPQFGNIYKKFTTVIDSIIKDLDYDIIAFCWMQGEADARNDFAAEEYDLNLKNLINSVRVDFNESDLPFIFGIINPPKSSYRNVDVVRNRQKSVGVSVKNTYLINTDDLSKNQDGVHYNSEGQLMLGRRFGEKIVRIMKNFYPQK